MPAETKRQATLFKLAKYYKKHGRMPPGVGKASAAVKRIANDLSEEKISEFTHTKKRRGSTITGRG